MRDAHLVEHRAFRNKTGACIETGRMKLRVQLQRLHATPLRFIDQRIEQRRSDTAATHLRQHSHAPDVAIGQQPAATDGMTIEYGQRVHTGRIVFIPFEMLRNPLLDDEYGTAYRLQS